MLDQLENNRISIFLPKMPPHRAPLDDATMSTLHLQFLKAVQPTATTQERKMDGECHQTRIVLYMYADEVTLRLMIMLEIEPRSAKPKNALKFPRGPIWLASGDPLLLNEGVQQD